MTAKLLFNEQGIKIFLGDCLPEMEKMEDNQFELAIVDVPYGIGASTSTFTREGKQTGKSLCVSGMGYHKGNWDKKSPSQKYFDNLIRISENQIVWGANHFISKMPYDSSCWIVWDKETGNNLYADCELAWTSFDSAVRKFTYQWKGMIQGNMQNKEHRIHPTQKPVALYKWLLQKYARQGDKIFDSHLGSGSIAIACLDLGFELTAYEIDEDYLKATVTRIKNHLKQPKMFKPVYKEPEQTELF